ncbi:MAG: lamin tail domain-containing protein, partial [Bacteroidetes bacterium]|nr:lamin tail domain-containing protein [Bacteroidota bacterium]
MAKQLHLFALCIFILSQTVSAQLVINEYSCSNRNIIADNYGDYEDYIELYNNSGGSVDLNGWYL